MSYLTVTYGPTYLLSVSLSFVVQGSLTIVLLVTVPDRPTSPVGPGAHERPEGVDLSFGDGPRSSSETPYGRRGYVCVSTGVYLDQIHMRIKSLLHLRMVFSYHLFYH